MIDIEPPLPRSDGSQIDTINGHESSRIEIDHEPTLWDRMCGVTRKDVLVVHTAKQGVSITIYNISARGRNSIGGSVTLSSEIPSGTLSVGGSNHTFTLS